MIIFTCSYVIVRALHASVFILLISSRRSRRWFVSGCLRGVFSSGGEYRETSCISSEPGPADDGRYATSTTRDDCCFIMQFSTRDHMFFTLIILFLLFVIFIHIIKVLRRHSQLKNIHSSVFVFVMFNFLLHIHSVIDLLLYVHLCVSIFCYFLKHFGHFGSRQSRLTPLHLFNNFINQFLSRLHSISEPFFLFQSTFNLIEHFLFKLSEKMLNIRSDNHLKFTCTSTFYILVSSLQENNFCCLSTIYIRYY